MEPDKSQLVFILFQVKKYTTLFKPPKVFPNIPLIS